MNDSSEPVNIRKKFIFRAYQVIWYVLGIVEVVLVFRFILKLIGANQSAEFVRFLYKLSEPMVWPFKGVLASSMIGHLEFDWATLLAMAVYAAIAYGLVYLFQLVKPVNPDEVEKVVDNP